MNCSQVAMVQIIPALCPHGQGEGEGRGAQLNVERPGQVEGGPKILRFVRTFFMDDPKDKVARVEDNLGHI